MIELLQTPLGMFFGIIIFLLLLIFLSLQQKK